MTLKVPFKLNQSVILWCQPICRQGLVQSGWMLFKDGANRQQHKMATKKERKKERKKAANELNKPKKLWATDFAVIKG